MSYVYYNEIDPFAADWLEALVSEGVLPDGAVDRRSITEVEPADLDGFTHCHFFAGIGGWAWALTLADYPLDQVVWTGSCPCQPFSNAGGKRAEKDERHLWPAFYNLIAQCLPPVVFGEQTNSPLGRDWLAVVRADLEDVGYRVGAADLSAASIGAPHIRSRLYFGGALAHDNKDGRQLVGSSWVHERRDGESSTGRQEKERSSDREARNDAARRGKDGHSAMGHTGSSRVRQHTRELPSDEGEHEDGQAHSNNSPLVTSTATNPYDWWSPCVWLPCTDGVSRPAEPGTFPLAAGLPGRVGLLRGYGNSIVPPLAQAFIEAFKEAAEEAVNESV